MYYIYFGRAGRKSRRAIRSNLLVFKEKTKRISTSIPHAIP